MAFLYDASEELTAMVVKKRTHITTKALVEDEGHPQDLARQLVEEKIAAYVHSSTTMIIMSDSFRWWLLMSQLSRAS